MSRNRRNLYAAVAGVIDAVPPRALLDRVGVAPGMDVLDVATGTGNVALRAAALGCQVVGLDLTPELFETARRRAGWHDVVVDWVDGDAEQLPFEDASFDRVFSAFGVQFAPRHAIVARELVRVCRPGGRIGLVNWWGDEAHFRALFAGTGVALEFARGYDPWQAEYLVIIGTRS